MGPIRKFFKSAIFFKEPEVKKKFILRETKEEKRLFEEKSKDDNNGKNDKNGKKTVSSQYEGKNNSYIPKKIKNSEFLLKNKNSNNNFKKENKIEQQNEAQKRNAKNNPGEKPAEKTTASTQQGDISKDLKTNLEYIKDAYTLPDNGDLILREFDIIVGEKAVQAFMIFFDGMIDRKIIDDNILQPLMLLSHVRKIGMKDNNGNNGSKNSGDTGGAASKTGDKGIGPNPNRDVDKNSQITTDTEDLTILLIRRQLLNHHQIKESNKFQDIIDEVNFGGCGIFVNGINSAFAADVKGWEHRTVSRPNTELVIRGPQEGFNEILRVNTGLIRKILKDEKLVAENILLGKRSKTPCSMMYIKDLANEDLVKEVRRRLKSINVDYLTDSGELEQLIEDDTFLPNPQILATERPDRVATMLTLGKVAIVLNGNPFVLVVPTALPELVKSAEDSYIRFPYTYLIKVIRIMGMSMALLLPGLYVAITSYHHEMIPTDLLIAIANSREKVPFPSVVEILLMELAFELIREAGIRIPGPIGSTLGIIGALILGQAAVAANIVSPILIIIVAVTGIGSFAVPNFSMAFAFRILRFAYIFLGALAGFLGITFGIFLHGLFMVNAKSFGVPIMAPIAPRTSDSLLNYFIRVPIWKEEKRPDYVNPKKVWQQEKISRGWTKEETDKDGNNE